MSFPMDQIEHTRKTTWKSLTDLKKTEIVRLYDALSQTKSKINREAEIRRMIHFPPEHETVFANLIRRVHRIFEDNECPSANYKTKCYKELKHVLNEFQEELFSDSGESVRFIITTRSPKTLPSPKTLLSPKTLRSPKPGRSPQRYGDPAPLQPSSANLILNMPDWKRIRFAEMILERNTYEEKTNFIKKYVYATDDDGEPFPALLRDVIVDTVFRSNEDDLDLDTKTEYISTDLMGYGTIHILYPFPAMYSNVFSNGRRNPNVRNLGGGNPHRRKQRTKKVRKLR